MKNIFENMNCKVNKFSTGIKEDKFKKSDSCIIRESFDSLDNKLNEQQRIVQEQRSEQIKKQKEIDENIIKNKVLESQLAFNINKLYNEGKTIIFKDILFETICKSLYLDEDFVTEQSQEIKILTDKYVDDNGGFKLLENAIKSKPVTISILQSIKNVCESVAKEVCERKTQQAKKEASLDDFSFVINDEEKELLDYKKTDLDLDELADAVKNKVLTVVLDEKERQNKEEELYGSIEEELKNDETLKTEEDIKEAATKMMIKNNPIEETTLFNALLRHSYKDTLESLTLRSNEDVEREESNRKDESIHLDMDDVSRNVEPEQDVYSLNKEIEQTKGFKDEELVDKVNFEIDMDLVLAEAICKYTLLEVSHTLGLEKFTRDDIKRMTQKLIK